ESSGATIRLHAEVTAVEGLGGADGWDVRYRDRNTGRMGSIRTRTVVGTAGVDAPGPAARPPSLRSPEDQPACGFKIQLLLPFSVVSHKGVMLCIGTRRLSGLAQLSNADPSLAPPGRHLVNAFHACQPDADAKTEREEALR